MKPSDGELKYPNPANAKAVISSKTFQIRYEKKLSSVAKLILNSFQKKYIYYAIDDILYSFQSNSTERENLLAILYSPVLSLQNNFSIDFSYSDPPFELPWNRYIESFMGRYRD